MSDGELSRLEVLRDLDQRRLTAAAAAQLLGLERRQVYRLLKAYRTEGPAGLISKRRGRSSNRRKPEAVRTKALSVIRERYWDFGPTPAFAGAGSWRPRSCTKCIRSRSAVRRYGYG
jgi:transposase